jgi:hypothetical protein
MELHRIKQQMNTDRGFRRLKICIDSRLKISLVKKRAKEVASLHTRSATKKAHLSTN